MALARSLLLTSMLSIIIFVFGGTHAYVWLRLVRATELTRPWAPLATALLISGAVAAPLALSMQRRLAGTASRPLMALAYGWMGYFFFLFVCCVALDAVLRTGLLLSRIWVNPASIDQARRIWLLQATGVASVAAASVMAAASLRSAAKGAQVLHIPVALARLPRAMHGFRIAQISDLHVAPLLGYDYVAAVVAKIQAEAPDMIVLTGDLVDGSVAALAADIAPLAQLSAPHGVYMVTGNHEYYSGADAWLAHLQTLGIKPLRNAHVAIGDGANGFDLAGIDDWTAHSFGGDHGADLPRALQGRDPGRAVVLLAHQPRAVHEAAAHGVDLVVSGHTHGGQLWPFGYLVRLVQPYLKGLHRHSASTQIYVNVGTGYWGPPMRLGAPPEIAVLHLEAPGGGAA